MKLYVHPNYSSLRSFVENLPVTFENEGTTIYKVRNEIKVFKVGDQSLNVKRYGVPHLFNRIVYTWLRKSKTKRAFENAVRITELGFDTPAPVAFIECYRHGLLYHSYFISSQCPYTRQFKEFADDSPIGERLSVVEELGQYVARLHQAGVYHKDLSNGNILFETDQAGTHFSLVDLNRMDFCTIGLKKGCQNFNRLRGDDAFFKRLAASYSRARGYEEDVCLTLIRESQQKSVRHFRRKSAFKRWRRRLVRFVRRDA